MRSRSPGPLVATTTLIASVLALAGCAMGPDYERPPVEFPDGFRTTASVTSDSVESLADTPWWTVFHDEELADLINEALASNYDARIAAARIEQARAGVWVARAGLLPQVGYTGAATRGDHTFLGNPLPPGAGGGAPSAPFFLGALSAAWEIDIWGLLRRETEAAKALVLASEEGRRAIWLSLLSEVATVYFELLELDLELDIARRTTQSFGESFRIFEARRLGGTGSKLETMRAEGALRSTAANIPDLERRIAKQENALCFLLGRPPGPIPRTATLLGVTAPPQVPTGLPALLLERRPDIRAAEAQLVAANARVGEALASFFPRIGLSTIVGAGSIELNKIANVPAQLWQIGTTVSGPIFDGGTRIGQYDAAKAVRTEEELRYREAILAALHDVSDALIDHEKLEVGSSRVDLQACKLEYSIVSPK